MLDGFQGAGQGRGVGEAAGEQADGDGRRQIEQPLGRHGKGRGEDEHAENEQIVA